MTEQRNPNLEGLTSEKAKKLQEQYGKNVLVAEKKENFILKVLHIVSEPMFLLLIVAAIIYFILGEHRDGLIMLVFVIGIISIDVIQEWKTDKTLNALKDLSAPHITVIRDGLEIKIMSEDLVPGDLMIVSEGVKIPADGEIIKANDLCVDESSLTGESEGVWKVSIDSQQKGDDYWRKDYCYAGTLVTQGSAVAKVIKIGSLTEYGKIGSNVASALKEETPLEKQTGNIVKASAVIAAILFVLVGIITYFNIPNHQFRDRIIESILSGITLAMAMIPEEFPVILTVFLSMGAWRLAKKNSLVHNLSSVETLGAVSVLCVDKTGTITMNKMAVQEAWAIDGDTSNLTEVMGLGCETNAYDPMEKAMISYCEIQGIFKDHIFGGELIKEYSFTNELKMMAHVWHHDGEIIIAAKGSPESVMMISILSDVQREEINNKITSMSKDGLRVIAVGEMKLKSESEIPEEITGCKLNFLGLIGLADPPRESVKEDIKMCNKAGIRVVMITGDNGITASAIAKRIGMENSDKSITGAEIESMSDEELKNSVRNINIFSRVLPEQKMRIVKAYKENGEIVAMTGDGVNDASALKYADIGIAMGKRGSEVAREAADLILMDDNFSTIVHTVEDGRRIYDNIKKAIGYVFTIHIPIALASLLAPSLNVRPDSLLLLPVHVVLLELIIDPTCSIVLERQPAEMDIMERKPRNSKENILSFGMMTKSVLQGLAIFIASFATYYVMLQKDPANSSQARAMGLSIIMIANLFLVQVNSSNYNYAYKTMKYLLRDKVMWGVIVGTILGLLIMLYTPLNTALSLAPLSIKQILEVVGIAAVSVLWYEVVKLSRKFI